MPWWVVRFRYPFTDVYTYPDAAEAFRAAREFASRNPGVPYTVLCSITQERKEPCAV